MFRVFWPPPKMAVQAVLAVLLVCTQYPVTVTQASCASKPSLAGRDFEVERTGAQITDVPALLWLWPGSKGKRNTRTKNPHRPNTPDKARTEHDAHSSLTV